MTSSLHAAPGQSDVRPGGMPSHPSSSPVRQDGGPRVLVVFAGRHGSTREIAATLARRLPHTASGRRTGLSAVLAPAQQRPDPASFDAVVLGSAVYGGCWLESARAYLDAHAATLARRATWSFSSGVRGPGPGSWPHPSPSWPEHGSTDADGHRWFAGRLERRLMSATERSAVAISGAPVGDHRDWRGVHEWAAEIADALEAAGVGSRRRPDRLDRTCGRTLQRSLLTTA